MTAGRIIFAVFYGIFGINHFLNVSTIAQTAVPGWLPLKAFWVVVSGIIMLAGAVFLIVKMKKVSLISALVNAGLVLFYIIFIHGPGAAAGGEAAVSHVIGILHDAHLLGGLVFFAGYLNED